MRKIFWCSVAVAIAAAAGDYLASKHVERPPSAVIGQALMSLGGEEPSSTGAGGEAGLPTEPTPVAEGTPAKVEEPTPLVPSMPDVVAVGDTSLPGHILIEEADPLARNGVSSTIPMIPQSDGANLPAPSAPVVPAPAVMPYCQDDGNACHRMPYAEEEKQTQEADDNAVRKILREVTKLREEGQSIGDPPPPAEEDQQETQCPEGHDYHREHPSCPYTGGCYPRYPVAPSAPEVKEEKKSNNEKPKVHESKKVTFEDEEEQEETLRLKLDTMEFRPSDAGFQPFVPHPF